MKAPLFDNGTKTPSFEAVEIGEIFDPVTIVIDEAYAKKARYCLDDETLWAGNAQVLPSTALARDLQQLFLTRYDPNRIVGLHQAEHLEFHAPVTLGQKVTLSGRCTDKFEKRGKGYFVKVGEAHDEEGRLLVRQTSTEIMQIPDTLTPGSGSAREAKARRVEGVWPQDVTPVERATRDIATGTPVRPMAKLCDPDQIAVFSGIGLFRYNTHTDLRVAQKAGFPTLIAQGMMETCWLSEMLAVAFGPAWPNGGWIKTNYLKPIFAGEEIDLRAVVIGNDDGRVELEVWAQNEKNEITAAGWAGCRLA